MVPAVLWEGDFSPINVIPEGSLTPARVISFAEARYSQSALPPPGVFWGLTAGFFASSTAGPGSSATRGARTGTT